MMMIIIIIVAVAVAVVYQAGSSRSEGCSPQAIIL